MIGVPLALGRAAHKTKRHLRGAAGALLVSGVFAGGLGLLGATPAGALGTTWFAYADGGATAPLGCPQTNIVASQCTLAQALGLATTGDTVALATPGSAGHYRGSFSIGVDLTLQPASGVINPVLDGGGAAGSVLTVGGATASATGITVTGGNNGAGGFGGGINNSGTLTLSDVTVSGNSAISVGQSQGGGIYNQGTITVDDSTVSDNNVTGSGEILSSEGGGMYNTGTAVIADSTFSRNTATGPGAAGAGIYSHTAITIEDSTVVDNSANSPGPVVGTGVVGDTSATLAGTIVARNSCSGPIVDAGYNLDDSGTCGLHASGSVGNSSTIDAYLGTLSDNGGPTETIPLLASPTSPVGADPALDVIPSSFSLPGSGPAVCSVPDQRGVSRIAPCDVGAYEIHPASQTQPANELKPANEETTTQLVGSATTVVPGGSVTFTATVMPTTDDGTGSTVTFIENGSPVTCSGFTFDGQTATCTLSYSTPGSYAVQASYGGDTVFAASPESAPWTVTVNPNPTTSVLTASDTAPHLGGTVTYTAMVSPLPDDGSVAFSDNGSPLTCGAGSIVLTNGVAECNVTDTAAGSHTVIATYSGDITFGPSTSNPVGVGVAVAPTTTSLTASNSAADLGGTVAYTATVVPVPDAGSVAFSDNGSPISCGAGSTTLATGLATCNVTYTVAGSHTVSAAFSGDTAFGPSDSTPVVEAVAVAPTTTTLVASDTTVGGNLTYTAMVSPLPDAGSVAFSDNGSPLTCGSGSTALANGVATCNVTYTTRGSHTVTATYSGDTAFEPSVSNTISHAVAIGAG